MHFSQLKGTMMLFLCIHSFQFSSLLGLCSRGRYYSCVTVLTFGRDASLLVTRKVLNKVPFHTAPASPTSLLLRNGSHGCWTPAQELTWLTSTLQRDSTRLTIECCVVRCSPMVFTDPSWAGHGHSCPTARFRCASQSPIHAQYLHSAVCLKVQSSAISFFESSTTTCLMSPWIVCYCLPTMSS